MNDSLISSHLASVEQEFGIVIQAIVQDPYLCIFINRPPECHLDYSALSQKIYELLPKEEISGLVGICFYSRVMGEVDPDWETYMELSSTEESSNSPLENSDEKDIKPTITEHIKQIPDESINYNPKSDEITEPFNLSQYCFTRNQGLLTAKILPPSVTLASFIKTFHQVSDDQKQQFLEALKQWIDSSEIPNIDGLSEDLKTELKTITELNDEKLRKTLIWLSRYCVKTEATLSEINAILSPPTVEESPDSPLKPSSEKSSDSPSNPKSSVKPSSLKAIPNQTTQKTHKSSSRFKIPVSWIALWTAFVVMVIGTFVHSNQAMSICSNSTSIYCNLAVQMIGGSTLKPAIQSAVPLTPSLEGEFKETCINMANLQAGIDLKTVFQNNTIPIQSLIGEEVLPGIYVVDMTQNNYNTGSSSVRVACVITATALGQSTDKNNINILGVEIIPNNWPEDPYKRPVHSLADLQDSLGILSIFMMLGAGTLFTALGIIFAAILNFGIQLDTVETAFKAAFFFQMIDSIFSFFWIPGLLIMIPSYSLILLLTSFAVKDFKMQWNLGFRVIAGGTAIIVGTRIILSYVLLSLISAII
ncbi:hypothetical protein PCC7424_3081 [Gloeothece citriformis PCC 7424]|uniref:Uncharacterized protein n=1 Tax=Gloeothece citriformis (strain PCC 7424) TaxID=65393 RepID=B7KBC7_GLOC7|nr:hypothetical protein [Gloeothece citriformis]ACK71483.1 hypothetical protein PCC7424_3081 [Gloeothece citriformis PCC 7424]